MQAEGFLSIDGASLEYRLIGPPPSAGPTIVLLHEGLGSVALWGDFPDRLAAATGMSVFAYSRAGYGQSSLATLPRDMTYMHREALDVLPKVLEKIGFSRGVLVGHSDGTSIATIYAGGVQDHRIRGLALLAPHFIVEEETLAGIREAKAAYLADDLRTKLARWHRDPDHTFWAWNNAWLKPGFRAWDITESLAYIRVPIQIVQGGADQYGTLRQISIAEAECYCPVDTEILPGIGHSPHREAAGETVRIVSEFALRIFRHEAGIRANAA
jgi:pimeloyl-ACP methyl ester carboxylesterase